MLTMLKTKSVLSASLMAVIASLIGAGVPLYQQFFAEHKVMIASSPAKAEVKLNGKRIGVSPITIELKRGTYTLEATKPGYENLEHAIYVSSKETNIVNLQLMPEYRTSRVGGTDTGSMVEGKTLDVQDLADDLKKLKTLIISDPEEAATIPILNERVRIQGEEIKALREDLKGVKEQGKWYLGSTIAIILGLLGVIASLFIAIRSK